MFSLPWDLFLRRTLVIIGFRMNDAKHIMKPVTSNQS